MPPLLFIFFVVVAAALLLLPPYRSLPQRLPALIFLLYLLSFYYAHRSCQCPPIISSILRFLADPLIRRHRYRAAVPLLRLALSWEALWGAPSLAATEELGAVLVAARLPVPPLLVRAAADLRAAPFLARIDTWLAS